MAIRVGTLFLDLDGKALPHPDTGAPWTVGLVLLTAALGPPPQGSTYSDAEHAARYQAAVDIKAALVKMSEGDLEATVCLPPLLLGHLKADVGRGFAPIIAGQMIVKKMIS